jgi:heptosyltransferase II
MKKILIIQTASIGDVILATALLESLHQAFPGASLDFLVKKGNESLFTQHPFLNKVISWDKRSEKYSGLLHILRQVRQTKYDLVVNVQRFFTSGLLTVLSGALETRGFSKNPLSFLFTRKIDHLIGNGIHEVTRNHALISDLAGTTPPLPRLYPSPSDEANVEKLMKDVHYTVSPASLWFTKQFPAKKWVELIDRIQPQAIVYLLGAPNDQQLCDEIVANAAHPGVVSLAGKLSFLHSAALMKHARMNFTNDSAPMHLASAVNAPITAVYCSTVPEFGFRPLSDNSSVVEVSETLPCRPCGLHGYRSCPEIHFKCALNIDADQLQRRL